MGLLRYCHGSQTCPNKVTSGLCPEHAQPKRAEERRHYTGTPGVNYGRRWQREAKRFLVEHAYRCVDCALEGIYGTATEVDHEIPHKGDYILFWDRDNWRPRCKPHHSRKTALEAGWPHAKTG